MFIILYWVIPRGVALMERKDGEAWLWKSKAPARRWANKNMAWSHWKIVEIN